MLYDLGHVSSWEPYRRLYNQGYIQAYAYRDRRGQVVEATEVTEAEDGFRWQGQPVQREFGKMGKSLKNSVNPDELYAEYGADTFRLYEMSMAPLGRVPALGDPRGRGHVPVPATAVAQSGRRAERRAAGA